jgi:predicted ATPase/DNA-binding SARP family transcriptional activator
VQVGILGPLEVRDADGGTVAVSGSRLRALLAWLALHAPQPVSAALLVDVVWGEDPPADAGNALQTLVSRLRRVLGDAGLIAGTPSGYRLAIERDLVDANRFAQLAASGAEALQAGDAAGARAELTEALALWRGPALDDVGDAALAHVARLSDLRLAALCNRIDADLELGDSAAVVAELEALCAERPLDERLAGQLMRALAQRGRQADALLVYTRIRAELADQLGVDVSAALQEVHVAVLRGEVGAPAERHRGRTNLKAQLTSFVGRDDEVARIGKLLEANRLLTLVGPGGAGKTRLAGEAAAAVRDTAPDGVWLVELASVTEPRDIAQAVLGVLGVRDATLIDQRGRATTRDALSRLIDALADKRTVLIVDNCEHLIEAAAALVDTLLARSADLRVIATSREPLGIVGETLFAVPPLGLPAPHIAADEALLYPAVRLFADRAVAVRPDFAVDAGSVATVIEIVRRLDGLPLAIELAAARLRALRLAEIAERLSDRFRLLTGGSRTAMPRHRTLRAVVEWSWDLLDDGERHLVERLAVFPAGVTLASASAVGDGTDVLDTVTSLVDKSLLQAQPDGRYRMLETIREYGIDRLAERGELAQVRQAHAAYFAELVRQAEAPLRGRDQVPWIRTLNAERDNILAALRHFADAADAPAALELAAGIGWYWALIGAASEAGDWLQIALDAPGTDDPELRMLVESLQLLSSASAAGADPETMSADLDRMGALRARLHDADVERYPLLLLMRAVMAMFTNGIEDVDEELAQADDSSDEWIVAAALMFRAAVAENTGDPAAVRHFASAAYDRFVEIGDRWGLASCQNVLGTLDSLEGDLDSAVRRYDSAMRMIAELGAHDDEAWINIRLADVHVRRGDLDAALTCVDRAIELAEDSGWAWQVLFVRAIAADLTWRRGEHEESRRARRELVTRLEELPPVHPLQGHGIAVAFATVAQLEVRDGELDAAAGHLRAAYQRANGTDDQPILAAVGTAVATLRLAQRRYAEAAEVLGVAAALRGAPDLGHPDIAALTAALRATLGDAAFDAAFAGGRGLSNVEANARLRDQVR